LLASLRTVGCLSIAVLAAGCASPGTEPRTLPTGPTATASARSGSGEEPFEAGCDGSVRDGEPPGRDDFTVGPLRYAGAAAWARTSPPSDVREPDGRYFYKTGAVLPPGAVVTVTIAPAARGYAAIDVTRGPEAGSASVTYRSCPSGPGRAWIGGFLLTKKTACLPLDVGVLGEPRSRHVVLPVYRQDCGR
jgi:hypothetical protein